MSLRGKAKDVKNNNNSPIPNFFQPPLEAPYKTETETELIHI